MLNFLSNGWFVSIVCGLLVTLSWETIKLFLERKAYNRQIKQVRYDFSMIIKNIISEDSLPNVIILENLLKGIAQKHKVKFKDVSEVSIIFYSLTGDVMESNFLDHSQKILFCEKINTLSNELSFKIKSSSKFEASSNTNEHFKFRLLNLLPVLSISTAGISLVLTYEKSGMERLDNFIADFLIQNPIILGMIFILTFGLIIYLIKRILEIYKFRAIINSIEDEDDED